MDIVKMLKAGIKIIQRAEILMNSIDLLYQRSESQDKEELSKDIFELVMQFKEEQETKIEEFLNDFSKARFYKLLAETKQKEFIAWNKENPNHVEICHKFLFNCSPEPQDVGNCMDWLNQQHIQFTDKLRLNTEQWRQLCGDLLAKREYFC